MDNKYTIHSGMFAKGHKGYNGKLVHGMADTRPHIIWMHMINRCYNPKNGDYPNYGGRGIKVTPKWRTFVGFWGDMKHTYAEKLTIERVDNNMGYSKSNCRWATRKEQGQNRRTCRIISFKGEKRNIKQWAEKLGINYSTLITRLNAGWEVSKALNYGNKI